MEDIKRSLKFGVMIILGVILPLKLSAQEINLVEVSQCLFG
jgi:hypothetical protein